MTTVSVVVPAYNAGGTLQSCLRALASQDFPKDRFEVIVVDDGSSDNTASVARSEPVTLIERRNGGAAAARNTGWRKASGEWIAFTDADCLPARPWLRMLVDAAEAAGAREQALGSAGKTVGFESKTAAARFCDMAGSLDAQLHLSHPTFPFAPSSNLMYRRSALQAVDGFDERYTSYEACDLHWRITNSLKGAFVYEPRALVLHRHRADWHSFWRQQYSYGKGYAQFVRYHRDACHWTFGDEARAWADISKLGLGAWRAPDDTALLYRRGMLIKKLAQRLGFLAAAFQPEAPTR